MYNPKSTNANEFIDNEEILKTLEYAKEHKNDRELIEKILKKAENVKGIDHREASVLLECEEEDLNEKIYDLAKKIK